MTTLKTIEKKLKKRKPYVPSSDDPVEELRTLVVQHKGIVRRSQTIDNISRDKVMADTGEVLKCPLPEDTAMAVREMMPLLAKDASAIESKMLKNLRQIPIWQHLLANVFGCGPVVGAYLAAMVKIQQCTYPSQLIRYCGNASIDGGLEKGAKGSKRMYAQELRTRLYQMMLAMWKNAAKTSDGAPHGSTTKYLTIWTDYKARMEHSPRIVAGKNLIDMDWQASAAALVNAGKAEVKNQKVGSATRVFAIQGGKRVGEFRAALKFIHSTGRLKATDVFLEDVYMVWRAIEGLPVWPSWYAAKLGYLHGGQPLREKAGPYMLTLEDALELVGEVGAVPLGVPRIEAA